MYYATYDDSAIQLGIQAKADPGYLVRFWTTEQVEAAYNRLMREHVGDDGEGRSWGELDQWGQGAFVEEVEQAMSDSPEGDEATAAMERALTAAVRQAIEKEQD